jgi:hypothetical protein
MHKNATKCNKTLRKWCKNKHGASKIIDTFETYQILVHAHMFRDLLISERPNTLDNRAVDKRVPPGVLHPTYRADRGFCHVSPKSDLTRRERVLSQSPTENMHLSWNLNRQESFPCITFPGRVRACRPALQPVLLALLCVHQ